MSFAFMPLYTGDYIRDTRHLTPAKHGILLLLLMHCWDQQGPLPLDEQEIAGIANCRSADEVEAMRYVLARFFVKLDDGYYNKRMSAELERADALSRARSNAGRKGYEGKRLSQIKEESGNCQASAKQLPDKCQAIASTPTLTPTPTPTPTENTGAAAPRPRKRGCVLPEGFGISPEVREWSRKHGYEAELDKHLEYFLDYARANKSKTYSDWDAAFRNCIRADWGGFRRRKVVVEPTRTAAQAPADAIVAEYRAAKATATPMPDAVRNLVKGRFVQ